MRKKLSLLAVALIAMLQTAWAYDFSATSPSGHTLYYEIISGTTNVGVVRPGPYAAYNNYVTGNVVIPDTVIYNGVTYNVTELKTLNNNLTSGTFGNCTYITSVTIPNSVTIIGNYAFYGCSGLTSITISNSVTSIGNSVFWGCSSLTSVNIPNSVTYIGSAAFFNCSSLTSVNIPNSVTYIRPSTFCGCTSLTSVTIPNSVTSIGQAAFSSCSGLTSVTIPNSVTSIGYNAFYNVRHIIYNGTASGRPWGALSINGYVEDGFVYNDSTKTSVVRYIGTDTNVTIPNSVTTIGVAAFRNCTSLTSIIIPNSVTSIGNSAFADCSSLNLITIPNSVTSIESNTFNGCSNLDSVTIPDSVTAIGNSAFSSCTSLDSVIIPNSVTSIGNEAFNNCSNLHNIISLANIPPSLGSSCFSNIPNDATIKVPCAKSHLYTSSSWNNYFSNIVEMCDGVDTVIYATICPGETYTENGFNVSVARGYLDTLQSANNSDSIILLRLSINPTYDTTIYDYIGPGETYTDNGFNVSQAGTYIDTLQTINGCDSIVRLVIYFEELPACPGLKNPQNFIMHPNYSGATGFRSEGISNYQQQYMVMNSSVIQAAQLANEVSSNNNSYCQVGNNEPNRFIIKNRGMDPNTNNNLPYTPPLDTTFFKSIRLGNCYGGAEAEGLYYTMQVTPQNSLIFINYAIVAYNALHGTNANPEFIIRVKRQDASGNFVNITDSLFYIVQCPTSSSNLGVWSLSGSAIYKPWAKATINLNNYLYETIRIEIYVGDCAFSSHYGYCYIAAECMPSMQLTIDSCSNVVAQAGLESYQWFRKNSLGEWDTIQGANTYKYKPRETDFYTDSIGNRVDSNEFRCLVVSRMLDQTLDSTYLSINVQRNQINFNLDTIIYDTICANEIYTENGFNVYGAGEHIRVVQSSNGCDSTITLLLTVNPVQTTQLYDTISLSETYNDNGFNTNIGGVYINTLQAVTGCDSIVMLHLSIDSTYYTTIFDTICDNETYTENGFNTAFAGTHENTLQATIGCDSVITLHLTVNPTYTEMVYDTIYVEEGRDSSYYVIDSLQTIFGCDSVVVHNITIIVDPVSITENSDISDNLDLYPNPTTGIITFNRTDVMKVEVLDAMGRLLMTIENKHIIDLSKLSQGYYTLRVTLPEGVTVRKVIKQ